MLNREHTAEQIYETWKSLSTLPVGIVFYLIQKRDGSTTINSMYIEFEEHYKNDVLNRIENIMSQEDFKGFPEKGDITFDTEKMFKDYMEATDKQITKLGLDIKE
jgi:hypothetical protein